MQSRYGPGAKKEEKKAAPDSEPIPGAEEDPGTLLEGSPEEEAGETPAVESAEPDAAGLGPDADVEAVTEALKDVPPDVLKAAMAQLMPAEEGADDIDASLAAQAGRMSSGMEG